MSRSTKPAIAVAVLGLLLGTAPAEARFGKHSDSSSSSSSNSNDSSSSSTEHQAVPVYAPPSSSHHEATPVDTSPAPSPRGRLPFSYPVYPRHYYYGWGFGYYPWFYAPAAAPTTTEPGAPESPASLPVRTASADIQGHSQGLTFSAALALERNRFGLNGEIVAIGAREPGSDVTDTLTMLDAHLTWALFSGERGRLRLEGGFNYIRAPDISFFGPDVGASAALGLVWCFGIEASAHFTPYPHQVLDSRAGLTLGLGPFGFRAGYRSLWMSDRGWLDDVTHTDTFAGPYLGVALAF